MAHASRLTWFRWDLARLLFILTYVNGKILKEKLIIISAVFTIFGEGSAWIRQSHLHATSIPWGICYHEGENSVSPLCSKYSNFNREREKKAAFTISHFEQFHRLRSVTLFNKSCVWPKKRIYQVLPASPFNKHESSALNKEHIWESYACTVIELKSLPTVQLAT